MFAKPINFMVVMIMIVKNTIILKSGTDAVLLLCQTKFHYLVIILRAGQSVMPKTQLFGPGKA